MFFLVLLMAFSYGKIVVCVILGVNNIWKSIFAIAPSAVIFLLYCSLCLSSWLKCPILVPQSTQNTWFWWLLSWEEDFLHPSQNMSKWFVLTIINNKQTIVGTNHLFSIINCDCKYFSRLQNLITIEPSQGAKHCGEQMFSMYYTLAAFENMQTYW